MSVERRKVLEMLAAGKITAEEAEQLLERLSPSSAGDVTDDKKADADGREGSGRRQAPRFLRIVVDSPQRDSVNIRLPLALVRTGLKLSTMMPAKISRRLAERGIDLSHLGNLDDEALIAELAALQIDVAADDGEKVRVYCE